jgi:hypothetical protein
MDAPKPTVPYDEPIPLLEHALAYRARGWSIIPVQDKQASRTWKPYQKRLPDEQELRLWFAPGQPCNGLAVILGKVSGMLGCRDFDTEEAYRLWADRNPSVAGILPTARTGKGFHVYFTAPSEAFKDLKNGNGEYRADHKHYCVLPPSWHPQAKRPYQWLREPGERLPEIDPWGDELIRPLHAPPRTEPDPEGGPVDTTGHNTTHTVTELCPVASCCVNQHPDLDDPVEQAIRATVPTGPGQRNQAIFEFVRRIKALPQYREAKLSSLVPLAQRWHQAALPFIRTKQLENTLQDFANAWKSCHDPTAGCFVEALFEEVQRSPPHPVAMRFPAQKLRLLIGLCAALQRYNGAMPFFLSCRTAGRLLGVSHQQANDWIRLLEDFEIIRRTSTGTLAEGKANEFLFVAQA